MSRLENVAWYRVFWVFYVFLCTCIRQDSDLLIAFCTLFNHWLYKTSCNENMKVIYFKSSEIIRKNEGGLDRSVSNNRFSSVALNELTSSLTLVF